MQVPRASAQDQQRFRDLMADLGSEVTVKPMFGNLGAFVNGHMFAGLLGRSVGVRLSEADRAELDRVEGSHPFGPPGRPMTAYLSLPDAWLEEPQAARPWLERALAHVVQLPPKAPGAGHGRRRPRDG